MSRTSALLQQLLPALTLDLRDELQKESVSRARQSCAVAADICDSALKQLQDASVQLKRMHNTAFSRAQLPVEIWCLVWSFLPLDRDLINVTHVCASWRSAAICQPALWTRVRFWTTVHGPHDVCGSRCSCPTAASSTHNLPQVEAWLERSKTVHISLTVSIYPALPERALAPRLAAAVLPHAQRLTELTCECGDLLFFVEFTQNIIRFDNLRRLRICSLFYPHDVWLLSDLRLDTLHVPLLQEVHTRGAMEWDVPRPSSASRTVFSGHERLSCTFLDARSLFDALRCCPRLVHLDAELGNIYYLFQSRALDDDDPALFPQLETVVLDGLTPRWQSHVEPLVCRPALKELTLRYRDFDPNTLFAILAPLSGTLRLSILCDDDNSVCVRATAPHTARIRTVAFSCKDSSRRVSALGDLWRQLSAPDLVSLTISWDLRVALLNSALVAARLSRIRLLVADDVPDGESLSDNGHRPTLPMLSVLEIASASGAYTVSAASVRKFAIALSASELALLGVDDVQLV